MRLAFVFLALVAASAFGAVHTEQFNGTPGDNVAGWTMVSPVHFFANSTFKYEAGSTAKLTTTAPWADHAFTVDALDGYDYVASGALEVLVKFQIHLPDTGTNAAHMAGPLVSMSWEEGCNLGVMTGVWDSVAATVEWKGFDYSEEVLACAASSGFTSTKASGFLASDVWYIYRVRVSDGQLRLKAWRPDRQQESAYWDFTVSMDRSIPGRTGVLLDPNGDTSRYMLVDWFVYATNGDHAISPDGEPSFARRVAVVQ